MSTETQRYLLALDLRPDDELIRAYEEYHAPGNVWPPVLDSLREAGIREMQIYRTGNRLVMVIEAEPDFTFERKAALDAANTVVQDWETLMSTFQQAIPWARPGEKWIPLQKVFEL
jgi:L-rhamnose mutarotase